MTAFDYFATATASTKRPPTMVGNKRGVPVQHLSSFACVPLMPVDAQTRARLVLGSPMELQQTFVPTDTDIIKGDVLVVPPVTGREYPVRFVERWPWKNDYVLQVIVEKLGA